MLLETSWNVHSVLGIWTVFRELRVRKRRKRREEKEEEEGEGEGEEEGEEVPGA